MKITDLSIGPFFLDGGTIFGVVPKTKWSDFFTPNDKNQIELGLNPVLIEINNKKILVDCGTSQTSDKLIEKLNDLEINPEEITDIIFTHLHYDHCGGALKKIDNKLSPVFKNAVHHCSHEELKLSLNTDERTKHFYDFETVSYLLRQKLLFGLEPNNLFSENIYITHSPGHTSGHISVFVYGKDLHLIPGDAIPTEYHLKINYMTAYDENLKLNLKTKKQLFETSIKRRTIIHFYHSSKIISGYLTKEEKRYKLIL